MSLKVGLLTFHFSDNYGAALQAYALRRWFNEQNLHAEFIDYRPIHIEHGGSLSFPTSPAKLKANLKVIYLATASFINKHFGSRHQNDKFSRFRDRFLGVSPFTESRNYMDALDSARSLDLIVAGSDQIWSPSQHYGFDPNYFLTFARDYSSRRISYAASFGRDQLTPNEISQLPELLANFDAVSVREASGVELARQAGVVAPVNVPDPTLLHRDYEQLISGANAIPDSPYVFCYTLRSPDNIRQTAKLVASEIKTSEILSPHNPHRRWLEIGKTVHPDPAEWLALLKNARFVVTNSFHGTAFSLLYHKPFIVPGLTGKKTVANVRVLNLLRSVGLEDRFTPEFSAERVSKLTSTPIDWSTVDNRLESLRQAGQQFLKQQLLAISQ